TEWMVRSSDDFYLIEPAEMLPEPVVRASGHLENFTDPEVSCADCRTAYRADTLLEASRPEGIDGLAPGEIGRLVQESGVRCPRCGGRHWTVPRPFNLMFSVDFGATGDEKAYLRPETAQSSYLAFARMWDVGRHALPLGIAVIGRAYRNEIAPRQVLFRSRAF
ncbi:glycyl-tRNA synthetase, partial [mine drainage metagenome]